MAQKAPASKEPATSEQAPGNAATSPDTKLTADAGDQSGQTAVASPAGSASIDDEPAYAFHGLEARPHQRP